MNNIPVSVILPTYNRAKILPRAINSVLSQSYSDFELIVVDDASQDETEALVTDIDDSRVRYLRQPINGGAAAARNAGIAASVGTYLAFQDSDDVWHPHKLERQMRAWQNVGEETAVIYTQFWRQKGNRRVLFPSSSTVSGGNIQERLLQQNVITTQAAIVRRTCLEEVGGFDEKLPCLVDWELWLRMAARYQFYFWAETSVTVHFTPQSISVQETALANALCYILHKHAALFEYNSRLLAHHHYKIGHLYFVSGDKMKGISHLKLAIRLVPDVPRYWLTWSITHLGVRAYRRIYRWKTTVVPDWY